MSYRYVFWDLDGTIIDSYRGVTRSVQYALRSFGINEEDEERLRRYIGPPLRDSFQAFAGLTAEQAEQGVLKYRERYTSIGVLECTLFPHVRETLEALDKAGITQYLSSSKPETMCHVILKNLGVEQYFTEVVGASLDGKIDTKTEVLNEAFRRAEKASQASGSAFDKSDVVLIGDTRYDAGGAKETGIDCIGVGYGFGTDEELLETGVLRIVADPLELMEIIRR